MTRLLCLILALLITVRLGAADGPRQRLNINRDWKFALGDQPGAKAADYDDSKWSVIGLPHCFSEPYFQDKKFYTGYGWYRKILEVPASWSAKSLFLEFDGAFQDAEVFVNGRRVGRHLGGYTGFSFDITSATKRGANVVAVRVNNNWNARLAPRAGDYFFPGGIYRDVWLVATNPLHVTWYGMWVTTPQVSKDRATVSVKTEVQNLSPVTKTLTLATDLIDPDGIVVSRLVSERSVAAGAKVTFDQTSNPIPQPKLWHPAHPFVYTASSVLSDGRDAVDNYRTAFGIRWLTWTADQGFFINGEHLYFHGANVHQDHAGWASAVTESGMYRDVKLVKDAGLDFIRGSHYPHHPAFADACDRVGVLFWSENNFWGVGGAHQEGTWTAEAYPPNPDDAADFELSVENSLRDEIRIFRNHPSVAVWSMCNEVFFSGNQDKVKALLSRMVNVAHELDPTRAAAIGGCQRGGLDKLGDVAGYNGDGARLYLNPGIPSVVSEYGSVTSNRPGSYEGQFKAKDQMEATTPPFPWRSGQVVWCGFDYGTIFGPAAGSKGLVDYSRIPKRSWYWYRNEYLHIAPPVWPQLGEPAQLSLSADKLTIEGTDARDDVQLLVTVQDAEGKPISNSPPVTFTIESGPGEFPTGRSITFDAATDIPIRDGQAAIEFRSYEGGTSVIRAASPGLRDARITVTTGGEPRFVPGKTAVAKDRPYARYVAAETVGASTPQDVANSRPTAASSEAPGHNGARAVDGDKVTFWSAVNQDVGAWWQVDLEQPHTIYAVDTAFPTAGNYRYRIEGSSDGNGWTLLLDRSQTLSTTKERADPISPDGHWQFVRITFTDLPPGQPAAICDVKIEGRHWP